LADELLQKFTPFIESLTLTPSSGGRFEVTLNDELIYSKKELGRHAEPGEVARLFEEKTGFKPITDEG
jgi:selenoprotein W-related protein